MYFLIYTWAILCSLLKEENYRNETRSNENGDIVIVTFIKKETAQMAVKEINKTEKHIPEKQTIWMEMSWVNTYRTIQEEKEKNTKPKSQIEEL